MVICWNKKVWVEICTNFSFPNKFVIIRVIMMEIFAPKFRALLAISFLLDDGFIPSG